MIADAAGIAESSAAVDLMVDPEDQLRSNAYNLLGHLLAAPPSQESLDMLGAIDPDSNADETLLGAAWQMLQVAAGRTTVQQLDDEYHELFIGVGRGEMMPYGSWYMTGFLMEQPLALLRTDLDQMGFQRQEGVAEPEDHAAALCEVMGLSISSGSALEQQAEFFARHIAPWMGRFFRDMQQAKCAHFYRAVGQLGEQFIEVESQAFRMAVPDVLNAAASTRMSARARGSTNTKSDQEG